MNEQISQIAERLRGLRDALDLTTEDVAKATGISGEQVETFESGKADIPMSYMYAISQAFGIEISAIISGEDPKMHAYFLTRKGTGAAVERTKAYKYQALAAGFIHAKVEPFEVTVEPNDNPVYLNSHAGQEFNYVLEGTLLLEIAGNQLTLNEGDCIYFDATKPHGMKALNGTKVRFLAVII